MSQFWIFPRTRSLGFVQRNSFRFFPADRFARSNGTNETEKRNEFRSTKKQPRRRSPVRRGSSGVRLCFWFRRQHVRTKNKVGHHPPPRKNQEQSRTPSPTKNKVGHHPPPH